MNYRLNAVKAISRRKIFETFITPGFYIALSVSLLLGYFLINGFINSIDSSGLNYGLNPVYELIAKSLSGAFGDTFVIKLFSEGPFLFALYVAYIPFLLYLTISSVFKFGFEKKVGAIELLVYGPSDGTSYFLASLVKDIVFTFVFLGAVLIFFWITAIVNNLVLGPEFFYSCIVILFLSLTFFSYGIISSVVTDSAVSGIALFLGISIFFVILQMGSFAIISGYVTNLSNVLAWIVKWVSPLFYWHLALSSIGYGNGGVFVVNLFLLLLLSIVILVISHLVLKARGVRV